MEPWIERAKSLVTTPSSSTVFKVADSKLLQKTSNSLFPSNLALCKRPLDQAKIEAIELVDVSFP